MNDTHLKVARIRIGSIATDRESTLSSMLLGRLFGSESAARIRKELGLDRFSRLTRLCYLYAAMDCLCCFALHSLVVIDSIHVFCIHVFL